MGGILFIDDAYALDYNDHFGQEALVTLMKRMEDDRGKFIVIAAGYTESMEKWLQACPGLASRFTSVIQFDDFNPDELFQIFATMVAKKVYKLSDAAAEKAKKVIKDIYNNRGADFANAHTMRMLYEQCEQQQQKRLVNLPASELTKETLMLFLPEDIVSEF
jgi:hypothetical protein